MAANNSGLDFSSVTIKVTGREVIKRIDDEEEDMINEHEREEVLMKI